MFAEGNVGSCGNLTVMRELDTVIEGLVCHSDGVDSVYIIDAGVDACIDMALAKYETVAQIQGYVMSKLESSLKQMHAAFPLKMEFDSN